MNYYHFVNEFIHIGSLREFSSIQYQYNFCFRTFYGVFLAYVTLNFDPIEHLGSICCVER